MPQYPQSLNNPVYGPALLLMLAACGGGGGGGGGGSAGGGSDVVINTIPGSANPDTLVGGAGPDRIDGEAGSDNLDGGAGNDVLNGGVGNDVLKGGVGADEINGGAGIDTASYASSALGVTVDLSDTNAETGGDASGDTLTSIENLLGSLQNDKLTGDNKANRLDGASGNDTLNGWRGRDTLNGGVGNDTLNGGADAVRDTLTGGAGEDVFHLTSQATRITDADLIADWGVGGTKDKLATILTNIWYKVDTSSKDTILYGTENGGRVLAVIKDLVTPLVTGDFMGRAPSIELYLEASFAQSRQTASVDENTEVASTPVTPALKGPSITDKGVFPAAPNAAFRLNGDATTLALFDINESSGAVTWKSGAPPPNYEATRSYNFKIEYAIGTRVLAEQAVTVTIDNVYDVPVAFTSGGEVSLLENIGAAEYDTSHVVYQAVVTRDDLSTLVYTLRNAAASDFSIDPNNGEVTFKEATSVNHDGGDTGYSFTVVATVTPMVNGRNLVETKSQNVVVKVTDVNDTLVDFTSDEAVLLLENEGNERYQTSHVVYKAVASGDVGTLSYRLENNNAGLFNIANNGNVTFKQATSVNHDGGDTGYRFTVVATVTETVNDGADRVKTASQDIVVTVTDINDVEVVFRSSDAVPLLENIGDAEYGTSHVVYQAVVTRDDVGTLAYTLEGPDLRLFDIASNGDVTFKQATPVDHEGSKTKYRFTVVATVTETVNDGADRVKTASQDIVVTVTDRPDFTHSNPQNVPAGQAFRGGADGFVVYRAMATMANSQPPIVWSLSGADSALFDIDEDHGVVRFAANHVARSDGSGNPGPAYNFKVVATAGSDADAPSTSQAVTWTVIEPTPPHPHFANLAGGVLDGAADVADTFYAGPGADTFNGGTGATPHTDTVTYLWSHEPVSVDLSGTVANTGGTAAGDTLNDIENLIGSRFDDILTGDGEANRIDGGAGDDTINGGAGNDHLIGGAGDDVFIGGAGADRIEGGEGTDTVSYENAQAVVRYTPPVRLFIESATGVYINMASQAQGHQNTEATGDLLSSIEIIIGTAYRDVFVGNNSNNIFKGGAGRDHMFGSGGTNLFISGDGQDVFAGGSGSDIFVLEKKFDDTDTFSNFSTGDKIRIYTDTGDEASLADLGLVWQVRNNRNIDLVENSGAQAYLTIRTSASPNNLAELMQDPNNFATYFEVLPTADMI